MGSLYFNVHILLFTHQSHHASNNVSEVDTTNVCSANLMHVHNARTPLSPHLPESKGTNASWGIRDDAPQTHSVTRRREEGRQEIAKPSREEGESVTRIGRIGSTDFRRRPFSVRASEFDVRCSCSMAEVRGRLLTNGNSFSRMNMGKEDFWRRTDRLVEYVFVGKRFFFQGRAYVKLS